MSKSNKQILRKFENYLDHGDTKSVNQKETKKVSPKLSCSFNTQLSNSVHRIISDNKWSISLNESILQFKPCNRSKEYNFTTSVGITISNLLKKSNVDLPAVNISKEIMKHMVEVEKCNFKYEVCENGYINIFDSTPIEIKEDNDNEKEDNDKKRAKIEKNPLIDNKPHVYTQKVFPSQFHSNSLKLYQKYQKIIHHDDESKNTRKSYTRFLITTLVEFIPPEIAGFEPGRGSFHLEHYIDNKLVAVSVIDILTESVSSVYCFYDPDYNFLEIGKITILKEIEFAKKIKDMKYYTLGYYNPNVVKLKYKAEYQPCELLCDLQQKYYPFDVAYEKLKKNGFKYTPFVDNPENYRKVIEKIEDNELKCYSASAHIMNKLKNVFRYLGVKSPFQYELYF